MVNGDMMSVDGDADAAVEAYPSCFGKEDVK